MPLIPTQIHSVNQNAPKSNIFANHAKDYSDHGLIVFPCGGEDGKKPRIRRWNKLERTPPWTIEKYPDSNIGLLTGKQSGVTVVDIDDVSLLDPIIKRCGESQIIVETPKKGFHLYYQYNGEHKGDLRDEGLSVDIQGDSAFVVASPSINPKQNKSYRFIKGGLDDIRTLTKINTGALRTKPSTPRSIAVDIGQRNNTLFRSSLRYARGSDFGTLLEIAFETNELMFTVPLSEKEVIKTVKNAWEYEQAGLNWIGKSQRAVSNFDEDTKNPELSNAGYRLLDLLRTCHWDRDSFVIVPVAMAQKESIPGWGRDLYRSATKNLISAGYITKIRQGTGRGHPSYYQFTKKGRPIRHNIKLPLFPSVRDAES